MARAQDGQPDEARARYVAIITDGNGRWAQARGLPVIAGHEAGADVVKARLRDAAEFGIDELTVYSFSTENWSRSAEEVAGLMDMFERRLAVETPELHAEGVRMRFIGRRSDPVPPHLIERMAWAEELTADNQRITLFVAFNYGGRAEIVDAARTFTRGDEAEFRAHLYAPEMHDPDLIIRTSGEQRISNYLLWQGAYSELVFRDELWPDFSREAFEASLEQFASRRRRFGGRSVPQTRRPSAPARTAAGPRRPRKPRAAAGGAARISSPGSWSPFRLRSWRSCSSTSAALPSRCSWPRSAASACTSSTACSDAGGRCRSSASPL